MNERKKVKKKWKSIDERNKSKLMKEAEVRMYEKERKRKEESINERMRKINK